MTSDNQRQKTRLKGLNLVLGVTGSIAAFKAAYWVRSLLDEEARVTVVMTRAATRFVSELTFAALSGNRVYCEMFSEAPHQDMPHITLAREADLILIAPATANTIARLAYGMADDLLATTVLASSKPIIVCPAMNFKMYNHGATQDNLERLKDLGYTVVAPAKGPLACDATGRGRLPDWDVVRENLLALLNPDDLRQQNILITAGPTREALDPARYLSNRSSGKMGYALARTALRRGAQVTLVSGPVNLPDPPGVTCVHVTSAGEMHDVVIQERHKFSVIVKAAAVADFRPATRKDHKIKKIGASWRLELEANPDILSFLGANSIKGQLLVGFAAETRDHLAEGRRKLEDKKVDLIVINDILGEVTGFDAETNQVVLVDREQTITLPLMSKEQTANKIWDRVIELLPGK